MAGQEPPVSVAHAALAEALDRKLTKWARIGRAPEYFRLERRGPYKQTVMHELNRFGGQMGPYVDSQLQLRSVDYINASPIDNLGGSMPRFVATMCPKCSTFAHFWSMIWELRSKVIINLTHENDRVGSGTTDKREQYWPPFDKARASVAVLSFQQIFDLSWSALTFEPYRSLQLQLQLQRHRHRFEALVSLTD